MVLCSELFDEMGKGVHVVVGEGVLAGQDALHFVEVFVVFGLAAAVHIGIDYKGHLEASIANIMGVTQQQLLLSIFLLVLLILVLSPEGYSLVRLLVPALPPSSTFVGLFFCCWQISIQEWFIPVMSDSKARATLDPLSADVSRQFNRCCIRKSSMASCFTSLLSAKSDLLPMRVTQMEGSAYCWISFSQLGKFSKVLALVRSKTITAPTVFLQQLEAMARKRSWPAVSQIWFWMVLPSMCSTLVDSSTPMVALELS